MVEVSKCKSSMWLHFAGTDFRVECMSVACMLVADESQDKTSFTLDSGVRLANRREPGLSFYLRDRCAGLKHQSSLIGVTNNRVN